MQARVGLVVDSDTAGGALRLRWLDIFGDGATHDLDGLPASGTWILVDASGWRELAGPDAPLAALLAIAASHGMSPVPLAAAQREADRWAARPGIDDKRLVDLTGLPFVTIDEVHSKDLDQALAIAAGPDGFTVWYALADAAWFVRPGSVLFDEALRRGATYYLPGLVIPMLPPVLSEGLISLNPAVDRRALVMELRLDARGECVGTTFHRARVHCRHKLAFDGVQGFLDGAEVSWDADVQASLRLLPVVGQLRMGLADARDVVRYRRAEVDVRSEGSRFVALDGPRNAVERYNEQISLLANIEGARRLFEGDTDTDGIDPIYRVHEAPGEERLSELAAQIAAIVDAHGLDASWRWVPAREGLADYLDRLPHDRVARAIHRQAMVANRPSRHTAQPAGHHGIGAEVYGRFTAPMREVVGIFLHGELWQKLARIRRSADGAAEAGEEVDVHGEGLRDAVITSANRANELQRQLDREANRLVLDAMFREDLTNGRVRAGTVLGLTATQVHVQLDEPAIDVKLYVDHLAAGWRSTLTVVDRARLIDAEGAVRVRVGDPVQVRVTGQDSARDRWILALVQSSPPSSMNASDASNT